MKKIILSFIVLVTFFYLPVFLFLENNSFNTRAEIIGEYLKESYSKKGQKVDLLILGDSTASENIDTSHFFWNSQLLAIAGATISDQYYFLKEYLRHNSAPKCVLMSTIATEKVRRKFFLWENFLKNKIYGLNDIIGMKNFRPDRPFLSRMKTFLRAFLIEAKYPFFFQRDIRRSLIEVDRGVVQELRKVIRKGGGYAPRPSEASDNLEQELIHLEIIKDMEIGQRNKEIVKDLNGLLSKNSIRLYYLSPVIRPSQDNSVFRYIERRRSQIKKVFDENENFHILDYRFVDPSLFYDMIHLNRKGADLLGQSLASRLDCY